MTAGPVIFADVSVYQALYNANYAAVRDVIAVRGDSGYNTDTKIAENWRRIEPDLDEGVLSACIVYVVYIPGANSSIIARLKGVFGARPDPRIAWMIDMESGKGFAGPGNHSADANLLAEYLASWCGSTDRVIGYANGSDWANCWPTPPAWMPKGKRIIAKYGGTQPTGYFAWQYTNGQWTNTYGYPLQSPPFGACDHNVYTGPGGLAGMLDALGITGGDMTQTDSFTPAALEQLRAYLMSADKIPTGNTANPTAAQQSFITSTDSVAKATLARVNQVPTAAQIAAAVVAALPANPGGGATPAEVKQAVLDVMTGGLAAAP